MHQLLYRSTATEGLDSQQVFRIVEASARNNPARDVTGFLVFARDRFMQFVEGPKDSLDRLLDDLAQDPRHRDIEVLVEAEAPKRCFPAWRMRRVAVDPRSVAQLVAEMRSVSLDGEFVEQIGRFFEVRDRAA